ncbi:MAG: tRNA uridine-5-carboxymethylaminomethyl(34) synthesis GTPase MnmE [Parvibaculales bacterium]
MARFSQKETIYALASGKHKAAISIIRISGKEVKNLIKLLTKNKLPKPREASLCFLHDPKTNEKLEQALLVYFPAPHSYSGEDMAELHIHGGQAGKEMLLTLLGEQKNTRLAEAGEFTQRAVLNGKMDLLKAEAIADIIDAETTAQHKQALHQMGGGFSDKITKWREGLLEVLANIEADIEFADEDLPGGIGKKALTQAQEILTEIEAQLKETRGEKLRDGVEIAIIGPPNSGKSSLLNLLAGRDAAITTDKAGTTRDIIEVQMVLKGIPCILADMAGIRESTDTIEQEGIRRAQAKAANADICLVLDSTESKTPFKGFQTFGTKALYLLNKTDLTQPKPQKGIFPISIKQNKGIEAFLTALEDRLDTQYNTSTPPLITRARHRQSLQKTAQSLTRALTNPTPPELTAEDLRQATTHLSHLHGTLDIETLLDKIFSTFCIGK